MEHTEPSRALIAYAALADRLTRGGDVFQALMSFFRPIADEFDGEYFDADKFCARVDHLYGLQVPKLAALGWCERLVQEKLLEVHARTGSTTLYRWRRSSGHIDFDDLDASEGKVERLLKLFREKCEAELPRELFDIGKGRLEAEFFNRLLRLDSMRLLLRKDGNTAIKSSMETLVLKQPKLSAEDRLACQIDFIVADFILRLRDSSAADFELISSILFANMAAEAIATFREPLAGTPGISGMRVYLDTPLILDMFKVNTGFETYADELWTLLKKSGAQIKVFDHTVQETESVVGGRLASIRSGNMPRMYSTSAGLRVENLSMLEGRVAQSLEERGVVIERDPETSLLKLSARALGTVQADLDKKMGGWKKEAKYFDEKTVFSVIAIRSQMNVETTFAKAGALLLTRNTPLVAMANVAWRSWLEEATRESKSRIARAAPIAISDKQFAGLVWLISGQDQANPLSRARIVAHCAAAIRPRADVVAKACNLVIETHGKEEGDKFAALMTNDRAEQAVMGLSHGDPESVTKDRLPEIVEMAMLAAGNFAADAERQKAEAEKHILTQNHAGELASKDEELRALNSTVDLERAQVALELQNQTNANRNLKMGETSREIRGLSDKIDGFAEAFQVGRNAFKNSRWLVALVYVGIPSLMGAVLTDYPVIVAAASSILTFVGFWFLPEILFPHFCQWVALKYFTTKVQELFGRSAQKCSPDFVRGLFGELDSWKNEKQSLEANLIELRQAG